MSEDFNTAAVLPHTDHNAVLDFDLWDDDVYDPADDGISVPFNPRRDFDGW